VLIEEMALRVRLYWKLGETGEVNSKELIITIVATSR
jgi:hypothetical protein